MHDTLTSTLTHFIASLGSWAYVILLVMITVESSVPFGFVIPGGTAAIVAGVLAQRGKLNVVILLATVIAASIAGYFIGFTLGRLLGRPWLLRYGARLGLRAEHLERIDAFFLRHGGAAVLFARFSAPLRASVPFVAGASKLGLRLFAFYAVLGAVVWSAEVVLGGYLAGRSWQAIEQWMGRAGLVVIAVALAVLGAAMWRRRRRKGIRD